MWKISLRLKPLTEQLYASPTLKIGKILKNIVAKEKQNADKLHFSPFSAMLPAYTRINSIIGGRNNLSSFNLDKSKFFQCGGRVDVNFLSSVVLDKAISPYYHKRKYLFL